MNIDDLFDKEVVTVGVRGNARFSAEEVISCAIIKLVFPNVNIIRTVYASALQNTDILLGTNIENHARAFNRVRKNIGYISVVSAVWKEFGCHAIQNLLNTDNKNTKTIDGLVESVWRAIDSEYMADVDSSYDFNDNESKDGIEEILAIMNLPYSDHNESNRQFDLAVSMAKNWLTAVIIRKQRFLNSAFSAASMHYRNAIEIFESCEDIAVFDDKENPMWSSVYAKLYKSGAHTPKLVVFPCMSGSWKVQSCPGDPEVKFSTVCPAPERWHGKCNFVTEGGVKVNFIHPTGFIGETKTKEEAIALAEEWLKG